MTRLLLLLHYLRVFAAGIGLLWMTVTVFPFLHWWTNALSGSWGNERGDVLIVLGGDFVEPNMIGLTSYWRSYYAVRVWRTGHYRRIIVTGKTVAPLMKECITSQGVPPQIVVVENASTSTRENALYVGTLLRGDTEHAVLLTSDFHMGRALRVFRKAGIQTDPLPIPDAHKRLGDWKQRWDIFLLLFQETAKVAYYKLHGWM
jgi:uncharacterized SAM-binding protein YcdF (DUF218 family)